MRRFRLLYTIPLYSLCYLLGNCSDVYIVDNLEARCRVPPQIGDNRSVQCYYYVYYLKSGMFYFTYKLPVVGETYDSTTPSSSDSESTVGNENSSSSDNSNNDTGSNSATRSTSAASKTSDDLDIFGWRWEGEETERYFFPVTHFPNIYEPWSIAILATHV